MRHDEDCQSWQEYHFLDCPECKIIQRIKAQQGDFYTYDELEEARQEGYDDGSNDTRDEMANEVEEAYDRGFDDGKQDVIDNPEMYGLVEDDS